MAPPRLSWRFPLMVGGILILLAAMWGGLLRLGWDWPGIGGRAVLSHGALMIGGFFGTVISLERAVALGRAWTYGAPGFAALGGLSLLFGLPERIGQSLLLLSSIVLVIIFIWLVVRHATLFMITMGLGAVSWGVGNALWFAGWPIPWLVSWWVGFLVLTIFGERLELSRFTAPLRGREAFFILAVAVYALGVLLTAWWLGLGWVVTGVGLLVMSAWLVIHDLAMRTIRGTGLPRFAAACLLSGYFWMATCGVLILVYVLIVPLIHGAPWIQAAPLAGLHYDAILHTILVGFVFAMIFGHAPIIFPAVLGIRMGYHPRFYAHLVLLQIAMLLRIIADLGALWHLREWGGLLTALSIVLFLVQTITSIERQAPAQPSTPPPAPHKPTRSISLGMAE